MMRLCDPRGSIPDEVISMMGLLTAYKESSPSERGLVSRETLRGDRDLSRELALSSSL